MRQHSIVLFEIKDSLFEIKVALQTCLIRECINVASTNSAMILKEAHEMITFNGFILSLVFLQLLPTIQIFPEFPPPFKNYSLILIKPPAASKASLYLFHTKV